VLITLKIKTLDLTKFRIINQANEIGECIWMQVLKWTHFQKETIGKQIVRSADSISANLSESFGRYSFAERKRFIYYARGSLCETINWLEKAILRELIDPEAAKAIKNKLVALSIQINACLKNSK
jgi:four helix bundle protein